MFSSSDFLQRWFGSCIGARFCTFVFAVLLGSSVSHAAPPSMSLLDGATGMCLEVTSGLLFQPQITPHFKKSGRTPQDVCECATNKLFREKAFVGTQNTTRDSDKRIGNDADYGSYMYMKILSSTMSCLASELDAIATLVAPAN